MKKNKVRLVPDYWENLRHHKHLFEQCFNYLYLKKYKATCSKEEAYNQIILRLHQLNVFSRFDPSKHPEKMRGKKFEEFLFNWIRKVFSEMYREKHLEMLRYSSCSDIDQMSPGSEYLDEARRYITRTWRDHSLEVLNRMDDIKRKKGIDVSHVQHNKYYPDYRDVYTYVGDVRDDALEHTQHVEIMETVSGLLRSDREKLVIDLYLQGYNQREIAKQAGCSNAHIRNIMAKIKSRLSKNPKMQSYA